MNLNSFRAFLFCITISAAPFSPALLPNAALADDVPLGRVEDGFTIAETDWPWWRGPQRNGTANADQNPPLDIGESANLVWKSRIPGRGHGSTIVSGKFVLLNSCDEQSGAQSVLCYSRESGKLLWQSEVHSAGAMQKNSKASGASSTPACDGKHVFVAFPNNGALKLSALSLDGGILWQRDVSRYQVHQGYGASPCLYQNLVIVVSDNKSGGRLKAFDRSSGDLIWERERPQKPNYPSPTIVHCDGKDQLVLVGCDLIESYDPLSGRTLWTTAGATTECVTSTLTDGTSIFTSGGYPDNHMSAIRADGSGETVWRNRNRLYVPSLVIHEGYLFGILDAGIAMCWRASNGEEMWKARLGGTFSASPVIVGSQIFACNESGECFVFEATPKEFKRLAKSKLGDEVFATPTIADSRIYHRVAMGIGDDRQEWLFCVGSPK
ncbi:MAG: PQQ-binding-like beta-propeller repeat protein [Aureliella sp.]